MEATNAAGARLCPDLDVRLPYVTRHGSGCMAYSTLAEGVEAFVVPDVGYVGFARQSMLGERLFALGDPVAPPDRWGDVVDRYLAEHPKSMFVQIGAQAAQLLRERGFYVNEMGTETEIDVQSFKLGWRKRKSVTYMHGLAKRSEPTLREIPAADVPSARMKAISDEWISTRVSGARELKFLTRPAVFEDEPGVRKFYSCVRDEVIGFAYFSPMYEDGKLIGYLFDVHRHIADEPAAEKDGAESSEETDSNAVVGPRTGGTRIPDLLAKGVRGAPRGLTDWTLVEAMNVFRAEGVRTLSLGFSPFHDVDDRGPGHSPFTRWLLRTCYTKLDWLYHNTGNAMFKQRWKGTTKKVYFASRRRYPVLDLLAVYRLCGAV